MFRHKDRRRTYRHNLHLAAILSLVAGMVNISGILAIGTLTTNVTGHFAYFAEELVSKNYTNSILFLIYIISFLLGAFSSSILIEIVYRRKPQISHALPVFIEIVLLGTLGLFGDRINILIRNPQLIACILLFAMGMQNALVTQVSNSIVRTTHLTGLFTDLGIELAQLFYYKENPKLNSLLKSIRMRITIIIFFFIGCVSGGFLYISFEFKVLLFASVLLAVALFFDNIRYFYLSVKKQIIH